MTTLAIWAVAIAIVFHALKGPSMADLSRLTAAVDGVATEVSNVAAAIRNPATDNNDQSTIDDLAGRLEGAAASLRLATADENAEDAGTAAATAPADEA